MLPSHEAVAMFSAEIGPKVQPMAALFLGQALVLEVKLFV